MTPSDLLAHLTKREEELNAVKKLWNLRVPGYCPSDQQFSLWLDRHPFDVVVYGVRQLGAKLQYHPGELDSDDYILRWVSKVMINEQNAKEPKCGKQAA